VQPTSVLGGKRDDQRTMALNWGAQLERFAERKDRPKGEASLVLERGRRAEASFLAC